MATFFHPDILHHISNHNQGLLYDHDQNEVLFMDVKIRFFLRMFI